MRILDILLEKEFTHFLMWKARRLLSDTEMGFSESSFQVFEQPINEDDVPEQVVIIKRANT